MSERITGQTQLLTLMGYPIRHSSSPQMHNEALSYLGLDYAYLCFEVDQSELENAIKAMRAFKVRGGNVTMPNKVKVMEYIDKVSPEAKMCGAVNMIVNENGVLTGYNTDGLGYVLALKDKGIDFIGKKLTIVGSGGVGKPMVIELALNGAKEISIFNIKDSNWTRAEDTVKLINGCTDCKARLFDLEDKDALKKEIEDSFILANATGVGMKPMEGKTWLPDKSYLRPDLIVTDVIYSPRETRFLQMAREVGCRTMNGHPMMLFQGAAAFKVWTGKEMPIDYMKGILGIE